MSAAVIGAAFVSLATTPGLAGQPDPVIDLPVNAASSDKVPPAIVPKVEPGTEAQLESLAVTPATDLATVEAIDPANPLTPTDDADVDQDDGDRDYATLAAAVADQPMPATIDGDLQCLATGVYFESKGEPLSGQLAVANVILNRAGSHRFPRSVCGVLTQPHQFSFVRGGRMPAVNTSSRGWRTAVAVAQVAMDEEWKNPVPGALFFHARYVSPRWRLARVGAVGNHIFYR